MKYSLAFAALLSTWITLLHTAKGQADKCCLMNRRTKARLENIVSYRLQVKGHCPINSVAFMTNKDKELCWDPQEPFAQKAMRRLDQNRLVEQVKEAAPTPAPTKDIVLTTVQLSSSNSTQIQTEDREVRAVDNGRKKNSKNGMKKKRRNRRRMRNSTVNKQ